MSSTNAPPQPPTPPPPPPPPAVEQADPYEPVIEERIHQTGWAVRWVDVATGLLTLGVGVLVYLLLAAVLDQWVVPGGLGFAGRLLALVGLLAGGVYFFAVRVLPPLVRRVNPVFAAYTIERSEPRLKNSLVNFLLLRSTRQKMAPVVYRAIEQRAATDLSQVSVDTAVDRGPVIRLSYVLAALVGVAALYLVLSPKNPFVSAARVLWPWADIAAPTRVKIDDVQPGDATVFHGEQIEISAEVRGTGDDEPVLLYFTTADGQSVDQAVPLVVPEGGFRHRCVIPPGSGGLQQDVEYYLKAGDCRTRPFQVHVEIAPTIVVETVEYIYPEYTGLPGRTVEGQADIKAIEGTTVRLAAQANLPIQWAQIDLDCDGRGALKMQTDGERARGKFKLRMSAEDPGQPEYACYQLLFSDTAGRKNVRPTRHRIEVVADLPPRVALIDPPPDMAQVPVDGTLELKVEAEDPDFGLRRVQIRAERDGRSLMIPPLLDLPRPEKPHEGRFEASYRFEPRELGLKPGDRVLYRAEAQDNKEPIFNLSFTDRRWLVIVGKQEGSKQQGQRGQPGGQGDPKADPSQQPPSQENQPGGKRPDAPEEPVPPDAASSQQEPEQNAESQPGQQEPGADPVPPEQPQDGRPQGENQSEQGQSGQENAQDQPGESGQQSTDGQQPESADRRPVDGQTNPGDAFEEILKHRREQEQQQNQQQEPEQQSGQQQPGQQQQPDQQQGQQQQGQQQQGQQQQGQKQQGQKQQGQKQQGQQQQGQQQQSGEQKPGDQELRDGSPDKQMPGEQAPSGGEPAAQQARPDATEQQSGKQSGREQPGEESAEGSQTGAEESSGMPEGAGQPSAPQGGPKGPNRGQPPSDAAQPSQNDQPGTTEPRQSGRTSPSAQDSSEAADQQRSPDNQPSDSENSQATGTQPSGDGDRARPKGEPERGQPQDRGEQEPREARGGDPSDSKGQPGGGQPSAEDSGSPSPQEKNQQREKRSGNPDAAQQSREESADSPSISPKDSDSQGDTAGDRSGGGQKGGGQRSNQSGTGSAGQNTAAEQGGSQSQQKGEGETGRRAGDQAEADRQTGRSGDRKGPGSQQQKSGEQGGAQPRSNQTPSQDPRRESAEKPSEPSSAEPSGGQTQSPNDSQPRGGSNSGNPSTGGQQPGQVPPGELPPASDEEPGGEAANREYAERATKLALEHLEEQLAKDEPDPELLERLGWNREQLAEFTRRWKKLLAASEQDGPQAGQDRSKLDDALQSLGLRPRGTQLQGGAMRSDRMKRLLESPQFDPPPGWKDHFEAYSRGISRSASGNGNSASGEGR